MPSIVEQTFTQWTEGKGPLQARIHVYEEVRNIPYAVVPGLNSAEHYTGILEHGKGSCMPKHLLLGHMYERLALMVLYAVYPFRWSDAGVDYPPSIRLLAEELPTSYHLACRVDIAGRLVLVDATLDPALEKLGLPVNRTWDGESDTILPVQPCGEEQLFHTSEARLAEVPKTDEKSMKFYNELNRWLDQIRRP